MDREKKNPYVTQIELERTEKDLRSEIDDVRGSVLGIDRKHDEKHFERDKTIALMTNTLEHLSKSINDNTEETRGMRKDFREILESQKETVDKIDKTVMEHDLMITQHEGRLGQKKELNGKWIAGGLSVFGIFIASLFGLAEVVVDHIISWFFSR